MRLVSSAVVGDVSLIAGAAGVLGASRPGRLTTRIPVERFAPSAEHLQSVGKLRDDLAATACDEVFDLQVHGGAGIIRAEAEITPVAQDAHAQTVREPDFGSGAAVDVGAVEDCQHKVGILNRHRVVVGDDAVGAAPGAALFHAIGHFLRTVGDRGWGQGPGVENFESLSPDGRNHHFVVEVLASFGKSERTGEIDFGNVHGCFCSCGFGNVPAGILADFYKNTNDIFIVSSLCN